MQNQSLWKPTKFIQAGESFRGSPDPSKVAPGSRLIADILARTYVQLLREHARGRLLDLGCGFVPLYEMYREQVEETVCVDWENSLHQNQYLDRFVDLNGGAIPFPDESFDTILLTDVLEHIVAPEPIIHEIARMLRPKGKAIITVPFFYWLHEQPHDFYRYTEFALRRFCERAGMEVLSLEPYGGAPEILADLTAKLVARFGPVSRLHYKIAGALLALPFIQRRSQNSARTFPLGYTLVATKP